MSVTVASTHLQDDDFLAAFGSCELPPECFRHGDHLRLAWLELHARPFSAALDAVRNQIRAFAAHHGKPQIYHETITTAWVALLASHNEPTFAEFLRANDAQLNAALLHRFWSAEALASAAARSAWVPPDKNPLPVDFQIPATGAGGVR